MDPISPDRLTIGRRIMYDIDRFKIKASTVRRIFNQRHGFTPLRHVTSPFLTVLELQAFAQATDVDVRSYLTPGPHIAHQECSNCNAAREAAPPADIRPKPRPARGFIQPRP